MSNYKHEEEIKDKLMQLQALKEGKITYRELINKLTNQKVSWMKTHLEKILAKYTHLSLPEQAYRIIFLEHMNISPLFSKIINRTPLSLEIHSYNFCPYLEACKKLSLSTRDICKNLLEPSISNMIKLISPHLNFSIDYNQIRDYISNPMQLYCRKFIWFAG